MREAETRDFRWLNTGEVPRYRAEGGAHPDKYERECGRILRENGFTVQFRRTKGSQKGGYKSRTPDTFIGGVSWELKNPESDNDKTVKNQMKKAVGKDRDSLQSDRLVISNVRSSRTVEQMVLDVSKLFDDGRFTEIREVIIVGKDGKIKREPRFGRQTAGARFFAFKIIAGRDCFLENLKIHVSENSRRAVGLVQ